MDVNWAHHGRRVSLVLTAALISFVVSSPAGSAQGGPAFFTGGGYGPTADVAIQGAIWDAQESAGYFQFYNCQLVGDVLIFARANARGGRSFNAQATIACS